MATIDPPDPADYTVEINAGIYSWTTAKGDAADFGIADPLTVGWTMPEDGLTYSHPSPMTATFTLALREMADIATLDVGDPVSIFVTVPDLLGPGVDGHLVSFRGEVGEAPTARPRKIWDPVAGEKVDGMLVTITAVDTTVPLGEKLVGSTDWPAENGQQRLNRIFTEAGVITAPAVPGLDLVPIAARPAGAASALSLVLALLNEYTPDGESRCYLMPNYTGDIETDTAPDPIQPYEVWTENVKITDPGLPATIMLLPGVFLLGTQPGLWGIEMGEDDEEVGHTGILNGDYTDFDCSWALLKSGRADTVVVTGPFATPSVATQVTATAPSPVPVTSKIDTDMTDWQFAELLADLHLVTPDSDRWQADEFTFFADYDPFRLIARGIWFNDANYVASGTLAYPVVLSPIPESQNPTGSGNWYAGTLAGAAFTLAKGRFSARVRLRRNIPSPEEQALAYADLGYLAPGQLLTAGPPWSTLGADDLDPRFSAYDYRLVRNLNA